MRAMLIGMSVMLLLCVAGCSAKQTYGTLQAWQLDKCDKLPVKDERDRCMSRASLDYDAYKRETQATSPSR